MSKNVRVAVVMMLGVLFCGQLALGKDKKKVEQRQPDFTKGEKPRKNMYIALGPTGAHGYVYFPDGTQILVNGVSKGSPADGKLMKHDVILGVISPTSGQDTGGGKFTMEARRSMGIAIEEAEKKANGGKLVLNVWRPQTKIEKIVYKNPKQAKAAASGDPKYPTTRVVVATPVKGKTITVELKLEVLGSYSATAPWDCEKTKAIIDKTAQEIVKRGLFTADWDDSGDMAHKTRALGIVHPQLDALGLLATGEEKYLPVVRDYARKLAAFQAKEKKPGVTGGNTWKDSYRNLLLGEYYLASGDKEVLPGLTTTSMLIARGVSGVGTWGHGIPERANGVLYGPCGGNYGCMNAAGLIAGMSLVVAQKAGIKHPTIDKAVQLATDFIRFYADKGCIPYGDHPPKEHYDHNGRMSMAAVLFDLAGGKKESQFFSRSALASYTIREIGHTGHFFSQAWGVPGVARSGPKATQDFMRKLRWYTELERRHDGRAQYQNRMGEGRVWGKDSNNYGGWSLSGVRLLHNCLPRKAIYITGKAGFSTTPLTSDEVKETEAVLTFDPKKLTEEQLLAALGSWSPNVRHAAAKELGTREKNVANDLIAMLDSPNRYARYGACLGLKYAGRGSKAAVSKLVARIEKDPDLTLRYYGVKGLVRTREGEFPNGLGEAAKAAVPALLKLVARPEIEGDSRRRLDQDLVQLLFGDIGYYPNGKGIGTAEPDVVIPAVRNLLTNPHGKTRGLALNAFKKMEKKDQDKLWSEVYFVGTNDPISGRMFGWRGVGDARKLIFENRIKEGIDFAINYINPESKKWAHARATKAFGWLSKYGEHVKPRLGELEKMYEQIYKPKYESGQRRHKYQAHHAKEAAALKKAWDDLMKNVNKPVKVISIKDSK